MKRTKKTTTRFIRNITARVASPGSVPRRLASPEKQGGGRNITGNSKQSGTKKRSNTIWEVQWIITSPFFLQKVLITEEIWTHASALKIKKHEFS